MVRFSHGLVSGRTGWSWGAWAGVWGDGLVWGAIGASQRLGPCPAAVAVAGSRDRVGARRCSLPLPLILSLPLPRSPSLRCRCSETRVAEPVVAEEEAPCRRSKRNRRNDWHRSRGPRDAPHTVTPLLVHPGARESRAPLSTRIRAPAGVPYTALCRRRSSFDGHNAVWGSPGNGLPENCATATKQAVETPGGGRSRPRMTFASRHRRAASRSGGATSAERDGRPVPRRTGPGALLRNEVFRKARGGARRR
jgi:hypothetical protein